MKAFTLSPCCLLLFLAFAWSCGEEPSPDPDCEEGLVRAEDGSCEIPEPTCEPDVPGSIVEACKAEGRTCFEDAYGALCGTCIVGFVEEDGACRPIRECADLECEREGRECISGNGEMDARCGPCLPGANEIDSACVPRTCAPGAAGSIAGQCAGEYRHCIEGSEGEEARCGSCYPGFKEERGVCREVRSCADLGCFSANRRCTPAQSHEDASCGECRAGMLEVGGRCFPVPNATCLDDGSEASILEACESEGRSCVAVEGGASCGSCLGDLVEDPRSRECVPFISCETLECDGENRHCVEDPQGRCGDCLPGYSEDPATGGCKPVRTCAEIECGPGEQCSEATEVSDAFCHPECGPHERWSGSQCTPCPPCDGEGEDGVWPAPSATGACICRTLPGYFYSSAGDVGTFPCDADGDGWVRESARLAMESEDPAIRANARCSLSTIDAVRLVNERGQTKEVPLAKPLELYETDRNDDPAILGVHWNRKALPAYNADGSIVQAHELNRFTKLCHDPRADYNDNGIPDVEEWADHPLGPAMRPEQQPFNQFSYFLELAIGHFEPPAPGREHGTWVIQERPRLATASDGPSVIAISYPEEADSYWQQCEVRRDPRWGEVPDPVGMDFAAYSAPGNPDFEGMNHHSQFKCLVVRDQVRADSTFEFTPTGIASEGFALNRCRGLGDGTGAYQECQLVDSATVQPGDVLWGGVPYRDYGPTPYVTAETIRYFDEMAELWGVDFPIVGGVEGYQGGCVNACEDALAQCPGFDDNPVAVACHRLVEEFGKFATCTSVEVCDGIDNTGIGIPDANTIEEGYDCDVAPEDGGLGECRPGTTTCIDSGVTCVSINQPMPEICDGKDNDCNGAIDDDFLGMGDACLVRNPDWDGKDADEEFLKGACRIGEQICVPDEEGGASIVCKQTTFPGTEDCSDVDLDCDGNPYTAGGNPENVRGCVNFYYDGDGDGYPASPDQVMPKCFCPKLPASMRGKYTIQEPPGGADAIRWDCCDSDGRVWPRASSRQGPFYSEPNECGNFEYNCDNHYEEKSETRLASACREKFLECKLPSEGWKYSVPPCGQSGQWLVNCSYKSSGGCNETQETRVQRCR